MREIDRKFKDYLQRHSISTFGVQGFLDQGADLCYRDPEKKESALLKCIDRGDYDCAMAIAQHKDYVPDHHLFTAINLAAGAQNYECVKTFLDILEKHKLVQIRFNFIDYSLNTTYHSTIKAKNRSGLTALHFALMHRKPEILKRMLDLVATSGQKNLDFSIFSLLETAFDEAAKKDTYSDSEEMICVMLDHPKYEAKSEDFGDQVFPYIQEGATQNSKFFNKIIYHLTLRVKGDLGFNLMRQVTGKANYFQGQNPELLKYARAYLKIFGPLKERNIVEGFAELKTCESKAAKFLRILEAKFYEGVPGNLSLLVRELEDPGRRFQYFVEKAALGSEKPNATMLLRVARVLRSGKFGQQMDLKKAGTYYQAALKEKAENAQAEYFDFIKANQANEAMMEDFLEFIEKQSGVLRAECQVLILELRLTAKIETLLKSKGLDQIDPEHARPIRTREFKAYVDGLKGDPDLKKIEVFIEAGADPHVGDLANTVFGVLLRRKSYNAIKSIIEHKSYSPQMKSNEVFLWLMDKKNMILPIFC